MKFPKITNCDDCIYYIMLFPGEEGCKKNKDMNAWICFSGKNKFSGKKIGNGNVIINSFNTKDDK